jgi:hypothetical protein
LSFSASFASNSLAENNKKLFGTTYILGFMAAKDGCVILRTIDGRGWRVSGNLSEAVERPQ